MTGTSVSTRVIRNGQDLGYLHRIKNYDFNYQQVYELTPSFVLKKGDELITRCGYKTTGRSKFTFGGESTKDEVEFVYVYKLEILL